MKISNLPVVLLFTVVVLLAACDSPSSNRLSQTNDEAPDQVSNVKVKNIAGGANIFYTLPDSKDLLYVKATYSPKKGKNKSVIQPYYTDSLTVDGFSDTTAHEVKLYTYSRGGNHTKPVVKDVHPLTPPFQKVFNSMNIVATFGGVALDYENANEANITITVLGKDSLGALVPAQREYTSKKKGSFSVRGFEPESQKFGYYVRDQFENYSDTSYAMLKPLFEEELSQQKFSNANFSTDSPEADFGDITNLWDHKAASYPVSTFWQSEVHDEMPFWITIDLGQQAKISRFVLYGRPHFFQWSRLYPKKFEVWGSAAPNLNDGIPFDNSWVKLGTFTSIPPSGEEPATQEEIDTQYPANGENFNIPKGSLKPNIRYFRIKFIQSYDGGNRISFGDISIFGQPKNNSSE